MDHYLDLLRHIAFPKQLMTNGLVFIWTLKSAIPRVIEVLSQKSFVYVENIVFSLFDTQKLRALMLSGPEAKAGPKRQKLESFFKIKRDLAEPVAEPSIEAIAQFLLTSCFDLPKTESVTDYLVSMNTDFLAGNKRTLLIFRRVG